MISDVLYVDIREHNILIMTKILRKHYYASLFFIVSFLYSIHLIQSIHPSTSHTVKLPNHRPNKKWPHDQGTKSHIFNSQFKLFSN